jgi:hypothetical protein
MSPRVPQEISIKLAASKQVWLSLDHIGVFRDQYRGAVALRLVGIRQ